MKRALIITSVAAALAACLLGLAHMVRVDMQCWSVDGKATSVCVTRDRWTGRMEGWIHVPGNRRFSSLMYPGWMQDLRP